MAFETRYTLVLSLLVPLSVCIVMHRLWPELSIRWRRSALTCLVLILCCHAFNSVRQATTFVDQSYWEHCVTYFPATNACVVRYANQLHEKKKHAEAKQVLLSYEAKRLQHPLLPNPSVISHRLARASRAMRDDTEELFWLRRAVLDPTPNNETKVKMQDRIKVLEEREGKREK